MSDAHKRIATAVIFAAGLISVALFMRDDRPTATPTETAAVAVVAAPERRVIAETDSNNDGVPDWQESLQVTEAINLETTTDETYEPPETLTEQFAQDFFEGIVRAENTGPFGATPDELVADASNRLVDQAYDTFLTRSDISIDSDNSPEAMARYGESIAAVIVTTPETAPENEAVILERAIRNQDTAELDKLAEKRLAYEYMLEETRKVTVPSLVQQRHLDLLNTYQALIANIVAMEAAFDDPMMALLRMKRYQDDADGLYFSIANLYNALVGGGATWEEGSIVYSVISIDGNN